MRGVKFFVVLCLVVGVTRGAVAEEPQKLEKKIKNEFLTQAMEAVPEEDKLYEKNANTIFQVVPRTIAPAVGKNKDDEANEGKREKTESEEMHGKIVQQLPFLGQQILLNSEAMKTLSDKAVDGPLALYKITMNMVEPAVAAGAQGAEVSTALIQANLYNSQQLRWSEYMADPDLYRHAMNSFQGCMAKTTKEKKDEGSWVKALQLCSGDAIQTSPPEGLKDAQASRQSVFTAKYHSTYKNADGPKDGNKERILISEMLFHNLKDLNDKDEPFKDKKDDWIKWFGDYELEIKPDGEFGDGTYPLIQGKAKRIKSERSVEKLIKMMTNESAKQIFKVLKEYCEYRKNQNGDDRRKETFSSEKAKEWFRQLSLPQKTFTMAHVELMWEIWKAGYGSTQNQSCDKLTWEKTPTSVAQSLYQTMVTNYASMIAQGHLVNTWILAEAFVARRTAGMSFDNQTTEYAYRLIYDLAQTNNLPELVYKNIDAMDRYTELMADHRAQQYGAGGVINQEDVTGERGKQQ